MMTMSEKDADRFAAALDKVDSALVAIRMEFEALAKESADRLAAFRAREGRMPGEDVSQPPGHPMPNNATLGGHRLTAAS